MWDTFASQLPHQCAIPSHLSSPPTLFFPLPVALAPSPLPTQFSSLPLFFHLFPSSVQPLWIGNYSSIRLRAKVKATDKKTHKKPPILHCVCEDQHLFLWSSPGSEWIYLQIDRRGRSISSWSCDQMNQSGNHSLDTAVYGVLIFRAVLNATTLLSKMTFYNTAATVCQLVSAFYLMGNPSNLRVLKHFVIRGGFFCII